jgi:hypothetical protein
MVPLHEFSGFRLYARILGSHSRLSFKHLVPVFIGQVRISSGGPESHKVDRIRAKPKKLGWKGKVKPAFTKTKASEIAKTKNKTPRR